MLITEQDLQRIARQLGGLMMEKVSWEREREELLAELEAMAARLEEVGNPGGLTTEDDN